MLQKLIQLFIRSHGRKPNSLEMILLKQKATKQAEKASQFSEEELKAVQEIQKTYLNIQADLGQVSVAKLRLQQQMDALDEARQLLDEKFKEDKELNGKNRTNSA